MEGSFQTEDGRLVPAVTAAQMLEVDRIAVQGFGLMILQMMENAGRSLALHAMELLDDPSDRIIILAGGGGNGGGGLCCARHLHNRGYTVELLMTKDPAELRGAAAAQFHILQAAGLSTTTPSRAPQVIESADLVVDALIGYSLRGAPRGRPAELITLSNQHARLVLSLDVPSGLDATTGKTPGQAIRPHRTLTLALPKTGLVDLAGDLYLADIGIPPTVYQHLQLGVPPKDLFSHNFTIPLQVTSQT